MQFEMKMPDLAATESEIRIARWIIEPGQKVTRGQALLEVETDKAAMEVESAVSGVLKEIRSSANEAVSVGQVIAVLEVEAAIGTVSTSPRPVSEPVLPTVVPTVTAQPASRPAATADGMFARNRAAAATKSAAGIPLSIAQRTAAKRLQESKQTIPHFYLQTSVNATTMIARRKAAEPARLAWDAFFVRAVAKAIAKFDRFRCRLDGDCLKPVETDAIGVAVDQEGELYVMPIGSPSTKTVEQISAEIRQNVERLRGGDMELRRTHPALMTVTNLGVGNIESFVPIINPPEPAILGIGRVMPTPVAREDGWIGVEPRCTLTLSVDHRVASGRYAAEFLAEIVRQLESL